MMKKIQRFMLNHPYISMAFILPFTLLFVVGIFSLLLNIVLPLILAFWLAGWVYTLIVDRPVKNYYQQPFWFVRY
ncbi:MAG: hypothetical protein QGH91_08195 [Candidatus Marinimicrobia bacterium]|jgi:hypothetical protein|nr:hypothetical protein [Candidatus Neomarinimicrobiota bacterium]MDP7217332.1 hypothetical protein [Candidatus Neomarinimicrobiota bacterium]MDP7437774.1 hypothetical protein [Candidatus Neomarinimicrobiota bacterium]HJL73787.1 hypothetical protein [Candidatus Neomarinimicrobiota bacterium]|tara:strand:- start:140 stop:364 length:225 start_codon:yes stop_codon:yes gene_type:complete